MLGCLGVRARRSSTPAHFEPARRARPARGRALHRRLPRLRTDLARGPRPPATSTPSDLERLRLVQSIATPERLRDLQARMPWAAQVTSLRRDGVLAQPHARRCPTTASEARIDDASARPSPASSSRSSTPRRATSVPPGETGELCLRGLRAASRATTRTPSRPRSAIDADGLVPHRRPRRGRRGRPPPLRRAAEGHAQGRRRERRRDRDRGLPRRAPGRRRSPRSSACPTRATTRCRRRSSSSRPGRRSTEEELIEFCLGRIATFKVPRYVRFVDRVADVRDEDPEVRPARADRARARGARASPRRRRSQRATDDGTAQRSSWAPPLAEMFWPVVKLLPLTSHDTSEAISSDAPGRPRVVWATSCSWKAGGMPASPKNSVSGT